MDFRNFKEFIAPSQGELPGDEVEIFTDLDLFPLDDDDGSQNGDDSVHQAGHALSLPKHVITVDPPQTLQPLSKKKVIPFNRTLKVGNAGNDVYAVKRALVAAGARNKHILNTPLFGQILKQNIKEFQHRQGVGVDGQYGPKTHQKLVRYFDLYSEYLYLHAPHPSHSSTRQKIVGTAIFGANHRDRIWYTQGPSRMMGVTHHLRPPKFPIYADCSAYATWCYWVAGAPDPNGPKFNYNGFGYTGTLAVNGKETWNPQPGDLCLYGAGWPYHHTTVYIGSGRAVSMGSSIGPDFVSARYFDFNQYRTYL